MTRRCACCGTALLIPQSRRAGRCAECRWFARDARLRRAVRPADVPSGASKPTLRSGGYRQTPQMPSALKPLQADAIEARLREHDPEDHP